MKTIIKICGLLIFTSISARAQEAILLAQEKVIFIQEKNKIILSQAAFPDSSEQFEMILEQLPPRLNDWKSSDYNQLIKQSFFPVQKITAPTSAIGQDTPFTLFDLTKKLGGDAGNGGGAYVCRNVLSRKIEFAQSVDLWEIQKFFKDEEMNLVIQKNDQIPARAQMIQKLQLLSTIHPYFSQVLAMVMNEVLVKLDKKIDHIKKYGQDSYLAVVPDSLDLDRPKYCPNNSTSIPAYEQVINFTNDNQFKLDLEIYQAMASETDRAALLLHESIYKVLRLSNNATNSKSTRRLVGHLFSNADSDTIKQVLSETIEDGEFEAEAIIETVGRNILSLGQSCSYQEIDQLLGGITFELFDHQQVVPNLYRASILGPKEMNQGELAWFIICKNSSDLEQMIKVIYKYLPSSAYATFAHRLISDSLAMSKSSAVLSTESMNLLLSYYHQSVEPSNVLNNWLFDLREASRSHYPSELVEILLKNPDVQLSTKHENFNVFSFDSLSSDSAISNELLELIAKYRPQMILQNLDNLIYLTKDKNSAVASSALQRLDFVINNLAVKYSMDLSTSFPDFDGMFPLTFQVLRGMRDTKVLAIMLKNPSFNFTVKAKDAGGSSSNLFEYLVKFIEPSLAIEAARLTRQMQPEKSKQALNLKNEQGLTPLDILAQKWPWEVFWRSGNMGTLANLLDPNK